MDERAYAIGYLRAIIDGEGHVRFRPPSRGVSIANTEQSVIDESARCLTILGLRYRVHVQRFRSDGRKDIYNLVVGRLEDMKCLAREVGSSIPYKQEAFDRILEHKVKAYRTMWSDVPMPDRDKMKALLDAGMRHEDAAREMGMSFNSFNGYAQRYGLQKPKRNGPPPTSEEVKALLDVGMGTDAIAKHFGYAHRTSILSLMRRYGIPIPGPGTHMRHPRA